MKKVKKITILSFILILLVVSLSISISAENERSYHYNDLYGFVPENTFQSVNSAIVYFDIPIYHEYLGVKNYLYFSYDDSLYDVMNNYNGYDILSYLGLISNAEIDYQLSQSYIMGSNINEFRTYIVALFDRIKLNEENDYLENEMESLYQDKLTLNESLLQLQARYDNLDNQYNSYIESAEKDIADIIQDYEAEKLELTSEIERLNNLNGELYNIGYNDGMTNADVFKGGLITIFTAPLYVFGEVFNFEIFGVNIFSIIQFILTILIAFYVIKFIR